MYINIYIIDIYKCITAIVLLFSVEFVRVLNSNKLQNEEDSVQLFLEKHPST